MPLSQLPGGSHKKHSFCVTENMNNFKSFGSFKRFIKLKLCRIHYLPRIIQYINEKNQKCFTRAHVRIQTCSGLQSKCNVRMVMQTICPCKNDSLMFTAVTMKNAVFWDMTTQCDSCNTRRFGGTHNLLLQGEELLSRSSQRGCTSRWTGKTFLSSNISPR
jgi:hypothetical protein